MSRPVIRNAKPIIVKLFWQILINKLTRHIMCQCNGIQLYMGKSIGLVGPAPVDLAAGCSQVR